MLFSDYSKAVTDSYHQQKNQGQLSSNLDQLTPAKLRNESVRIMATRFCETDHRTLTDFFGFENNNPEQLQRAMDNCDVDKFKPLINYLKGKTSDTDQKNIELLAWLLNLKPRPYRFGEMKLPVAERMGDLEVKSEVGINADNKIKVENEFKLGYGNYLKLGISVLGMVGVGYFGARVMGKPESCMYWNGEQYMAVACDNSGKDFRAIAMDDRLQTHFRKIMTPDTITEFSVGKVFYLKKDNHLDFFTSPGTHPVFNKELKPLSEHIFQMYILPLKR